MKSLIENLELVLTCGGLLVILAVALLLDAGSPVYWPVIASTTAGAGVFHGVIFWLIRRRQRDVRRKTLAEAQQMLKDVINNQLAVIQMSRETTSPDDIHATTRTNERVLNAIGRIADALNDISEESLKRWHSKHHHRIGEES